MSAVPLSPAAQALLQRLRTVPQRALRAVAAAVDVENELTVAHIQRRYLHFPAQGSTTPDGLRFITGSLARSVRPMSSVISGQTVRSGIGGNVTRKGVNYLAVHEYGATIPAHTITATNARALCFFSGGKKIFAKSVKIPAVTLRARAPIARGIRDCLPAYGAAASQEIVDTLGGKN